MILAWIILFSILGSAGAVLLAGLFLLLKKNVRDALVPALLSYATGALLASAFFGLIPHALEHLPTKKALGTVLIGIVLFFLLEKILLWRHCHKEGCEVHGTAAPLILIGDAFHNFADGIVIVASFFLSVPIGIAVGLSIIAHEVSQELGDFAILLHSGYSRKKALALNTLSGSATLFGALIAYFILEKVQGITPYIIALSAASFIYIALVDLSPALHGKKGLKQSIVQVLLLIIGIGTVLFFLQFHHE